MSSKSANGGIQPHGIRVNRLKVNGISAPQSVEGAQVILRWSIIDLEGRENAHQTAFRVDYSSDLQDGSTGWIESRDQSHRLELAATTGEAFEWTVLVRR